VTRITYIGPFQGGIYTGLEVAKAAEDAIFNLKLFRVLRGLPKGLKPEGQGPDDISSSDMIDALPEDA